MKLGMEDKDNYNNITIILESHFNKIFLFIYFF